MDVPILCSTEEFIARSNEIIKAPFEQEDYSIRAIYRVREQLEPLARNKPFQKNQELPKNQKWLKTRNSCQ
jgi:hypothetical protein